MVYDRFFGFDQIQRQTLLKLLAEFGGNDAAVVQLRADLDALEARVDDLEP